MGNVATTDRRLDTNSTGFVSVKERVQKLYDKIEARLYHWRWNSYKDVRGTHPTSYELYKWQDELKQILKELP